MHPATEAKLPFRPKGRLKHREQGLKVTLTARVTASTIALSPVSFSGYRGVIMIHRRAINFHDIARSNYYWNEIKMRMQVSLSGALLIALGLTFFYM